jgi:hypothetical protein
VTINGCDFDTTDDCISLKSGRGIEGYTIARPTEDVHISNCTFKDKVWACIGIGSETSGGIRDVYGDHCKCLGAGTFAIYIKSRPGRGAFIENIYMNDLEVSGAKNGFLRFNILNSGIADTPNLVPGDEGIPTIRNFEFRNIKVTDMAELVHGIDIHPRKPLDGFVLENVSGTCKKGISLANIRNAHLSGIKVTGFEERDWASWSNADSKCGYAYVAGCDPAAGGTVRAALIGRECRTDHEGETRIPSAESAVALEVVFDLE